MKKELFLSAFTISALITETIFAQNTWTQKADFGGTERLYAIGFSIGAKAYMGTGDDSTNNTSDFWKYDQAAGTWTQVASFGGGTRQESVAFAIDAKGYVGLGRQAGVGAKNDFWVYDTATNNWSQKANFPGTARYKSIGFSIGSKGYVGLGDDGSFGYKSDFYEYNPSTDTWITKTSFPPGGRFAAVGFSIGTKGYVGTGCYYPFNQPPQTLSNDFWEYNPSSNAWTQKNNLPGSGRWFATSFSIGNRGYLGTGADLGSTSFYQDFYEYDLATDTWIPKANFGGVARGYAVGFSIGSKGYIGTGFSGGTARQKDFWEYTPDGPPSCAFSVSDTSICAGDCVTFTDMSSWTPPTNWSWTFSGGAPVSSSSQNPSTICYNTAGNYPATLIASNTYGSDTATIIISVNICSGLSENTFEIVQVFPNPIQETIRVFLKKQFGEASSFNLTDLTGRIVLAQTLMPGINTISCANLPEGIYYFQLLSGKKVIEADKIVVIR